MLLERLSAVDQKNAVARSGGAAWKRPPPQDVSEQPEEIVDPACSLVGLFLGRVLSSHGVSPPLVPVLPVSPYIPPLPVVPRPGMAQSSYSAA